MKLLLILISFIFIAGCEPESDIFPSKRTVYKVKTGEHDFRPTLAAVFRHEALRFKAKFHSSTAYQLANNYNQINKLMGFSDCSTEHQENSARLGWIYEKNEMLIVPYVYVKGDRIYDLSKPLIKVNFDQSYEFEIKIQNNEYIFSVKTANGIIEQRTSRGCSGNSDLRYMLTPYFGGQYPAPHDMEIEVILL